MDEFYVVVAFKIPFQFFFLQAVISEFGVRGQKGRRLTFSMQQVPDVLVKGKGGKLK